MSSDEFYNTLSQLLAECKTRFKGQSLPDVHKRLCARNEYVLEYVNVKKPALLAFKEKLRSSNCTIIVTLEQRVDNILHVMNHAEDTLSQSVESESALSNLVALGQELFK